MNIFSLAQRISKGLTNAYSSIQARDAKILAWIGLMVMLGIVWTVIYLLPPSNWLASLILASLAVAGLVFGPILASRHHRRSQLHKRNAADTALARYSTASLPSNDETLEMPTTSDELMAHKAEQRKNDERIAHQELNRIGQLTWPQYRQEIKDFLFEPAPNTHAIEPSKFVRRHLARQTKLRDEPVLFEWWRSKKTLFYDPFPNYVLEKKVVNGKITESYRQIRRMIWGPLFAIIGSSLVLLLCMAAPILMSLPPWSLWLITIPAFLVASSVAWYRIRLTDWSGYRVVVTLRHLVIIYKPFLGGSVRPFELSGFSLEFQVADAPSLDQENSIGAGIAEKIKIGWAAGETDAQQDKPANQVGPFDNPADVVEILNNLRDHAQLLSTRYVEAHKAWGTFYRNNQEILQARERITREQHELK